MSFKVATMCSGIGSPEQSLAELAVPHKIVFACEKDKFARQTYLANFTPGIMYEDMTTESWDLPEQYADLIVAGIPCQSFSLAGKRKGENDPRGLLIYDFIRYVKNQRPKVFIIENVKGLLSDMGGVTFSKWCELLGANKNGQAGLFTNDASCGYNLHYRVLNAKHYGLPQNRERVFIIGIRPDLPSCAFRWPKPVVLRDRLIDLLEPVVDEKYYLSDTMVNSIIETNRKNKEAGNGFNCNFIDIETTPISRTNRAGYGKMSGDSDFIKVVGNLKGYESRNRIYSENGISPALQSSSGGQKVPIIKIGDSYNIKMPKSTTRRGRHGDKIANSIEIDCKQVVLVEKNRYRRYTPLECFRLFGYPDSFVKPCSETQTYKQAGNSIPVHMMKAILKQLLPILTS